MSCYQLQVKVIAVVEIVVSCLLLIILGLVAVTIATKRDVIDNVVQKYPDDHPKLKEILDADTLGLISMFLIPCTYFIVELGLAIFLFRSSDRLQYKRLRVWSTVTVTLVLVGIVYFVTEILKNEKFGDIIILHVLNLAFTVYSVWAVHCLMEEIKTRAAHHTVPYCTPTTDNYEYNYNNYDRDRTTSTAVSNGFYKL